MRPPQARVNYWAEALALVQAVAFALAVIVAVVVGSPWVVALVGGLGR